MTLVNVPGVGQVNFPDNMSDRQIILAIERDILPGIQQTQQAQSAPTPAPTTATGLGHGALAQGADVLHGFMYSSAEGAGNITGLRGLSTWGREGRLRNEEEAKRSLPESERMSFAQAQSPMDYLRATGQAIGTSLPSAAPGLAGSLAGLAVAGPPGAIIGGLAGSLPVFFGSHRAAQMEANRERGQPEAPVNELAALGSAIPAAAVESVLDRFGLSRILGVGADVVGRTIVPRILRGAGIGAVGEVPAELVQQVIERAQAGRDILSPEAMAEYKEVAQAAFASGLVMGGAGAGAFGPRATPQAPPPPRGEDLALRSALEQLGIETPTQAATAATPPPKAPTLTPAVEQAPQPATEAAAAPIAPTTEAVPPTSLLEQATPTVEAAAPQVEATPSPLPPSPEVEAPQTETQTAAPRTVATFKTAKGSVYDFNENGQTTRLKKSPGRGQGEVHQPHNVLFVSPEQTEVIMEAMRDQGSYRLGSIAPDGRFIPMSPGQTTADLASAEAVVGIYKRKNGVEPSNTIPASTTPAIGLHPVEHVYSKRTESGFESRRHVGNAIVDLNAEPEAAVVPEAVSVTTAGETAPVQSTSIAGQPIAPTEANAAPVITTPDFKRDVWPVARDVGLINEAMREVSGNPDATWGILTDDEKVRTLDFIKARNAEFAGTQEPTEQPSARTQAEGSEALTTELTEEEKAGQEQVRERAREIVKKRVDDLRAKGKQGVMIADALDRATASKGYTPEQLYAAFRAGDIMANLLPAGANHQVEFVKSLGENKQGVRYSPSQGLSGIIELSLAPDQLKFVQETAAHEAFHVLQDYYAKYDPKLTEILNRDFKNGMSVNDIPASIQKKLKGHTMPRSKSTYWDFLTSSLPDTIADKYETQAYVFGSLLDLDKRGIPITGVAPVYVRFTKFLGKFFKGMGAEVKSDGMDSLAAMERIAKGDAARFANEASPEVQDISRVQYSARQVPTPEFQLWFDGSKVVDQDGKPKILYHGTSKDKDFDKFKTGPRGAWFTEDSKEASSYAEENDSGYRVVDYHPRTGFVKKDISARVIPVYLSIKNPATLTEAQASKIMHAKNYAKAQAEVFEEVRKQGHDGVNLGHGIWVAFDPTQIKSATGNVGSFNPKDQRIQYSARATGKVNGLPAYGSRVAPLTPDAVADEQFSVLYAAFPNAVKNGFIGKAIGEERVNTLFTKFQDKMLSVAQMIDKIKKSGGTVTKAMDAYLKQDLMTGRVAVGIEDRESRLYRPLIEKIRDLGLTTKEMEDYLHARHAPERNERMEKINKFLAGTPGSGMSNKTAEDIIKGFQSNGKLPKLEQAAKLFDSMIEDTRRTRVEAGLSPDFESMVDEDGNPIQTYKYYAPLRRYEDESAFGDEGVEAAKKALERIRARSGAGYGARGKEDFSAMGSSKKVGNILAHAMLQNSEAVIRSEKNAVGIAFLNLIEGLNTQVQAGKVKNLQSQENPSGNIFGAVIHSAPIERRVVNGVVKEVPNNLYKNDPEIMVVKRDGREIAIRIDDPRIARAMKGETGLKSDDAIGVIKALGLVNQYMTRINTSLNPEFLITNFFRDLQNAAISMSQHDVDGLRKTVIGDVRKAMAGVRKSVRNTGAPDEFSKSYEEFRKLGGTTEMYGLVDIEGKLKLIEDINNENQKATTWQQFARGPKAVIKFLEDYNNIVENGIRVSTFHNLRKMGVSADKAAQVAKNLTTNFNRGGENRATANALYLFYNASVQGSMAMANALVRSKRVRKIAAGAVVAGAMSEFINAMMSGDDETGKNIYDSIPSYTLEHNFVLMDPFGITSRGYYQIPMPYGFNSFWNLGRAMSHMGRGQYTPMEAASSAIFGLVEGFNPIGGTNSFLNFVAPTILDPAVDIALNRNFAGQPIVPERGAFGPQPPASQLYWSNTAAPYIAISQFLSEITGGTPVIPGSVEISPNMLKYLTNYAGGALAAFVERTGKFALGTLPTALAGDLEEIDVREIPFVRKFYGNVTQRNSMEDYIKATEDVQRAHQEVRDATRFGESERVDAAYERYPGQLMIATQVERLMRERSKINREIRTIERMDMPDEEKKQLIKDMREASNQIVGMVNTMYNENVRNAR